jgi:transposase
MRKLNNEPRKDQIIKLRAKGLTYNEIQKKLGCSKSVISYHCGDGSEKRRLKKNNQERSHLEKKISSFRTRCKKENYYTFRSKVKTFKRKSSNSSNKSNTVVNSINKNYTAKDVLDKIGQNPICYLTGERIDLEKSETYNLDHIIPTALGGSNDLSNLQIAVASANQAKGELCLSDFYKLCKKVLIWKYGNMESFNLKKINKKKLLLSKKVSTLQSEVNFLKKKLKRL